MKTCLAVCTLAALLGMTAAAQSVLTIETGAAVTGEANTDICANSQMVTGVMGGEGTWCSSSPLPVELVAFSAAADADRIVLRWSTKSETEHFAFHVERKTVGGDHWLLVGAIGGSGTSTVPKEYTYADRAPACGRYAYRLKQIDRNGAGTYSQSIEVELLVPTALVLRQNFPNPFNPSTTIGFELPDDGIVRLEVFNVLGERIAELLHGEQKAGYHEVVWSPKCSSGLYMCRLTAAGTIRTNRMLLVR